MRTAAMVALLVGLTGGIGHAAQPAVSRAQAPKTVRLYVFDCGVFNFGVETPPRYNLTKEEVAELRMPVPCFLIAHPKGTMLWDLGVIPDGRIGTQTVGAASATRTLKSQLAAIGYRPADITYLTFSHSHIDHTANANDFAASTWLVRKAERDFMWAPNNPRVTPANYQELKGSKTVILDRDEYDVFGDGQVVIKSAPGHTPGHQVLILKLAKTGPVMISGDLYHYPEERTLRKPPPANEFSVEQSAASRAIIEEYLKRTGTQLWIEHDFVANARLRKSPDYYE